MFKEEMKRIVNELNRNIEEKDLKVNINIEEDLVVTTCWFPNREFECIYSGDKTMFIWLKANRSYFDYCETPDIVKNFFRKSLKKAERMKNERKKEAIR